MIAFGVLLWAGASDGRDLSLNADPVFVKNDFNADGKVDILWRNYATSEIQVWLMDGPNIIGGANLPTVADVNWKIAATGDFNGDGKTDILWTNAATGGNLVWYMNGAILTEAANLDSVPDLTGRLSRSDQSRYRRRTLRPLIRALS